MPEGDTVWNTARALERVLIGGTITTSDFRVPQLATKNLSGWTVHESATRGKHLLLRLTDPGGAAPLTLHSHLRMEGSWRTYRPGERWTGRPAYLIRAVLTTRTAVAVGYHLHELALIPTAQEDSLVGHLGPDLLGADWNAEEAARPVAAAPGAGVAGALPDERPAAAPDPGRAADLVRKGLWVEDEALRRLASRPERPIGEALLDQQNLAGVGNVIAAEVLFLAGVLPLTPVGDVEDLTRVVRLARRVLMANRGRWERVTTGDTRRGHQLWVYGRSRRPCFRCGTPIVKSTHGQEPYDRPAYWCPSCQDGGAASRATPGFAP